jgi:hypothetical protein
LAWLMILWEPYNPEAHFLSIPYSPPSIFAPMEKWSSPMQNAPRDAIPIAGVDHHQIDPDLSASSAYAPPAPSELFARLGVMLVVALLFGLSAQVLVGILPH